VATVGGFELMFEMKMMEGTLSQRGDEQDVAAFSSITAVWTALGDKLFTSETDATVSPVSGLNGDRRFVYEFHSG
jgi:hypothetical protein